MTECEYDSMLVRYLFNYCKKEQSLFLIIIPHVKILDSDWSRAMDYSS